MQATWRAAVPEDDDKLVELCLALNREDPGPKPVCAEALRRTLRTLRAEPWRGRAVVVEVDSAVCGYALLISFWSNEYGGEVCVLDEGYVEPQYRGQGLATSFIEEFARGSSLWPATLAALSLEVRPGNTRARALYERLGFSERNVTMVRLLR